ncbi:MAG: hypothetical protein L0H94_07775 [Nitrospira sp.]|nr:hypothetical protein [Nitrospira sp.]
MEGALLHPRQREEEGVVLVQVVDRKLHAIFPLRVEGGERLEVGGDKESRLVHGYPGVLLRCLNRLHRSRDIEEVGAQRREIHLGLE